VHKAAREHDGELFQIAGHGGVAIDGDQERQVPPRGGKAYRAVMSAMVVIVVYVGPVGKRLRAHGKDG
jgi:hypothetical protein